MGSLAGRMVVTADAERRRLERLLHDGAQQRLAALNATLALAQRRVEAGEPGALELIQEASEEAKRCLEDLRELAREIFPAVLARRGLAAALSDVARRSPGLVEIEAVPEERASLAAELAAYLVVSDTLADLGDTGEASVRAELAGGELTVHVQGGAPSGEQLERLEDRIGALGGRIEVSGRAELRAWIPAVAGSGAA